VVGHDQVSTITDNKATCIDIMMVQVVYFFKKHFWVNSYAIADKASYLRVKNARRDEMQPEFAIRVDYGVSGIISTGEANHYFRLLS
jgi:hypothetical protein